MKRVAPIVLVLVILAVTARAQDKVELHPRFAKGDSHSIVATLDQTISQTVAEKRLQTRQSLQIAYSVNVDDVDPRGIAILSIRYDSIRFDSSGSLGRMTFDSQQPTSALPQAAIGALVGQSFQATVSPIGAVQDVRGMDRLLAASLSQINIDEGALRQAVEKTLRQQLDPANMKLMLQNLFGVLPDHPVLTGDTWPKQINSHSGPATTCEATYALKARDNGMAIVGLTGRISTSPDAVMDAAMTKVNYALSGTIAGEFQIQESTGWTWLATINQTLDGSITLRAPSVAPQTVPITLTSKLKLEQK